MKQIIVITGASSGFGSPHPAREPCSSASIASAEERSRGLGVEQ